MAADILGWVVADGFGCFVVLAVTVALNISTIVMRARLIRVQSQHLIKSGGLTLQDILAHKF